MSMDMVQKRASRRAGVNHAACTRAPPPPSPPSPLLLLLLSRLVMFPNARENAEAEDVPEADV